MTAQIVRSQSKGRFVKTAVFLVGLLLLIGSGVVWFWWISLFTGVLLVPWDCCGLDVLPQPGTWQRAVNDFFAVFPGSILPSVLFLVAETAVLSWRLTQTKNKSALLLIFALANVLLLAVDLVVTNLSWAMSNAIVGPRDGIDAGFHRTWYGIVAHLLLWGSFLSALLKVQLPGQSPQNKIENKGMIR